MKRNFANPHRSDARDYGSGEEVERLVLDFLAAESRWLFLPDISRRLELDRKRLYNLLWRLYREGAVQIWTHELGYTQWRAA